MVEVDDDAPADESVPVSRDALRTIVAHLAHLRADYGDVLADLDLVEPTGEYFPDEFALEPAAIQRLARRIMTYAPLSADLEAEVVFVEPEGEGKAGGGCGSGACGPGGKGGGAVTLRPAAETEEGYAIVVSSADVGEPKLLTTTLSRSVGRLVLFEAGEEIEPRDEGVLSELTAVGCGLGGILLNGACVYKKGCGGMRRHQGTFLSVEELALATALFVRVQRKKPAAVRRHLEITQREAFDAALGFVDAQPRLLRTLENDPESLTDGLFELEEAKGFLSRLFTRKPQDELTPESLGRGAAPRSARPRSEEELRRIQETRALVEEALQEP